MLNLPWELLPFGRDGTAVGCDSAWELVRTMPSVPAATAAPSAGPLRVLFVAAAPEDQGQLVFEKEENAILTATGGVVHIGELGTVEELAELVQKVRPHVVHLSGHDVGKDGVGVFCFEDEAEKAKAVPAGELVTRAFAGRGCATCS